MTDAGERAGGGMTRRDALRTGGLVAGAALWVTPVVQVLSVGRASAETPSGATGSTAAAEKDEKDEKDAKDTKDEKAKEKKSKKVK